VSRGRARSIVFLASAAVLVLEILAGRLMAPYVGVSLETFTAIIGTVLAGIAIGSAVGGRMADRRDPMPLIASAFTLGGVLAWTSIPIVAALGPLVSTEPPAIVVLAGAAFFAPAAVLSAVSPLVAKMQLSSLDETGSVVGDLSATATVGALVGTFVTGFVLVAALPTRATITALGVLLVVIGLALAVAGRFRPPVAGVVVALVAFGAAAFTPSRCEVETSYSCARIVVDEANPSGRSLFINFLRNSYIDFDDPTFLEFRYMRLFGDVVDAMGDTPTGTEPAPVTPGDGEAEATTAAPLRALHLGGAGFTMPGYVEATRPGSDNLILEIDGGLVDIAVDQLGLELGPRMRVIVGDARLALTDLDDDAFDLIIGDAFSDLSVPWHLTTTEVIAELDRMLTDTGILTMNVIDGGPNWFARAELATLAEHFDYLGFIVPEGGVPATFPANQIIVASDSPLPTIVIDPADGRLIVGPELDAMIDGMGILTDDFAPVDQLTLNP